MRLRSSLVLASASLLVAGMAGPALAHPGQDRGGTGELAGSPVGQNLGNHPDDLEDGHLPAVQENVTLLGRADIEGAADGRVADVSAFGNYAYLTVRDPEGCSDAGVAIFDISDPTDPEQVGFIDATEGSFPGEGSQVVDLTTSAFTGQVLVTNNEICALGGEGGVTLWDVTDPLNPEMLAANAGDADPGGVVSDFNQTHSAFAWQDGDRAFVVIVDNEEATDVDILEITDPRKPVMIAELNLNELGVEQDVILGASSFLHDMTVQRVRGTMVMLLSYWDGGWVQLDVSDPANPTLLAESDFPNPDPLTGLTPTEGNAHQAEFSPNGKLILGTSEDFSPYRLDPFLITTGPNAGQFEAGEFGFTVPLASEQYGGFLEGPTIYGGLGCPAGQDYPAEATEPLPPASELEAAEGEAKVVVLLRGTCFFSEKVEAAQEAGYDAVLIANSHAGAENGAAADAAFCGSQGHEFTPEIAAFCIGHRAFHLLFGQDPTYTGEDAPALGTVGESVSANARFDGWGYVHLLDARTMEQLDAYAIDEALDPAFAQGFGDLSVHEVAVDPWRKDIAYLSYYAGGLRVIHYDEKTGITEVGAYIAEGGNNFWGVEVHRLPQGTPGMGKQTLILASDRDTGLWIFTYDGKPSSEPKPSGPDRGNGDGKVKGQGSQGQRNGQGNGNGQGRGPDRGEIPGKAKGLEKRGQG